MFRKLLIFSFATSVAVLALSFPLLSQGHKIDSLKEKLKQQRLEDSSLVKLYVELSSVYIDNNYDSALKYYNLGQNLSVKIGFRAGKYKSENNLALLLIKGNQYDSAIARLKELIFLCKRDSVLHSLADAYKALGTAYYHLASYDSALDAYLNSKVLYEQLGHQLDVASALLNIAFIQDKKGLRTIAMESYQDALAYFQQKKYDHGIATSSYNMAKIFEQEGEYGKALIYMEKVAHLDSISGNLRDFANTLGEIAGLYLLLNDTSQSIKKYKRAYLLSDSIADPCLQVKCLVNLGSIILFKDPKRSEKYFQESENLLEKCKSIIPLISSKIELGKYQISLSNYDKALKYLLEAYDLASANEIPNLLSKSSKELYLCYKSMSKSKKALMYFEIYHNIQDKIYSQESTRRIAQLEAEYEFRNERREFQLERSKSDYIYEQRLETEKQKQFFYVIGTIILFLAVVIIMFLLYQRNKVNRNLQFAIQNQRKLNVKILDQHEKIRKQSVLLEEKTQALEYQKQQLEKSNQSLKALNQEKTNIIGIVAHDLKTPLNHIAGLIKVIRTGGQDRNSVNRFLQNIEESALRSKRMIDKILDISSIENKSLNVDIKQFRLLELLSDVLLEQSIYADAKSIDLHLDYDKDYDILTDEIMFREIFDNVISNAIKYSPVDTRVKIKIHKIDDTVAVSISDQGPGIDENDLENIFDHYKTTKNVSTANEKSTGLGLAIVKKYVEALNYRIQVSKNDLQGSTFTIILG